MYGLIMTKTAMTGFDFSSPWLTKHRGFAYAVPILFVCIAAIVTDCMAVVFMAEPIGLLMLSAVIATASLAGLGPAVLAIALALLAFQYDITTPRDFFVWKQSFLEVNLSEAPRLVLFAIVSFIVSFVITAQSKATEALRRSGDELRVAVEGLKRTESALRHTDVYLNEAQRLSQTGSFGWNVSNGKIFWTDQTFRIFGFDQTTEPTIDLILQRTLPEDRAAVQATIEQASGERRDFEHQYRLLMPDGFVKHVHATFHAVEDQSGGIEFVGAITDVTAAREAEQNLRLSETYLAETQHLSHTSSWAWDERRKEFVYLSDELHRLLGVERGKQIDLVQTYRDRIVPEDKPNVLDATRQAIRNKTDFDINFRIKLPDGTRRHVHSVGHPVLDDEGDLIQLVGTNMDVTEQYEANERLQKAFDEIKISQEHLRLVIDAIPTLVWRADPDGVPDFLNQPALDYTGLLPDQIQFGWPRAFHPEDKKGMLKKWSAIRASGKRGSLESRLQRFDGEHRWFLFQAEPVRDRSGNIVKWYGSATDIEDRKLAELALRESEQRFRDYAETASDWLWETGPGHQITSISEHFDGVGIPVSRLTGMTRREISSDFEAEPEKWRRHHEILDAHLAFRDFVYSAINENGSQVYVRTSGKPFFDADGHFLGYRGTGTDITALIRAEQAERDLRRAQAELAHVTRVTMLGELTASIAHEVNQPLTAVVTNAEASLRWLNRKPPDLAAARRSVEWVINDGCRASDVVRRVRALAKKSDMETVRLELNQVVNEAIPLVERELLKHRVSLRTELAPALPAILGDRVQLQQVIINLLMNGIEATELVTDRPRELWIRSSNADTGQLIVSVTDNGIGISTENANRLFNAFFTTKSSGLGMGLSICRSIAEAHGGRLAASGNEGPGATFQLFLPPHREDV
jgi:PAS domain S-box-containing protein